LICVAQLELYSYELIHSQLVLSQEQQSVWRESSSLSKANTVTTSTTDQVSSKLVWKRITPVSSVVTIPSSLSSTSSTMTWKQPIPGLFVFEDFITPIEEEQILQYMDSETNMPWRHSNFNGPYSGKRWGVLCNLRDREVLEAETALPSFFYEILFPRLYSLLHTATPPLPTHLRAMIQEYHPNEANAIRYYKKKGHTLTSHCDDRQLSKEIIANVSLEGDCYMMYKNEKWSKEKQQRQQNHKTSSVKQMSLQKSLLYQDVKVKVYHIFISHPLKWFI